jgi:RNA polymerase sigma-70 factor (ECF subfamily)
MAASAPLWTAWTTRRDERAFETLVREEVPAICDAARRWGIPREDAEDVVQEALAALARETSDRPGRVGVGAWLMRTVRFRALNRRRANLRRARRERSAAAPAPAEPSGAATDVRHEVERALAHAAEEDREVLLLRFVYDLEYREVAYVLGISENACRIRVHRAAGRLRERLGPKGLAMLAAIPLPDVAATAPWIAAATQTAAGAGWAAAGGLLVGTASKMAVAAATAAALTAAGFVAFDRARAPEPAEERAAAPQARVVADPSVPQEPVLRGEKPLDLGELAPTDEETRWLKDALVQERRRRELAALQPGDSGLDVMRRVFDHGMDPTALLADFDAFASHVRPSSGAVASHRASGDVTDVDFAAIPPGTEVIEFGPGTFRLNGLRAHRREQPVAHLEIRGAGPDRTTLVWGPRDREFMLTMPHENVRVQGLTFDLGESGNLLDVRARTAAILEDVHLLAGSNAGHGAPIGVGDRAYLGLRRCTFRRTDGFAVSLRGQGLVSMHSCVFEGDMTVLIGTAQGFGGAATLVDCTFDDAELMDSRSTGPGEKALFSVRVQGGVASYGPASWTDERRRERWGAPFARSVEGLRLGPTKRQATPVDLARLLGDARLPADAVPYHVAVTDWREGAPVRLRVDVLRESGSQEAYDVTRGETLLTRHGASGTSVGRDLVRRQPNLLEALSRARVPPGFQATTAYYQLLRLGAEPGADRVVLALALEREPARHFDLATGEDLSPSR